MKFNLTPLKITLFFCVCLAVYTWIKYGRRIRRWIQDYLHQRRGLRNLKAKSPEDCPQCNRDFSLLPYRPKLDLLPWPERKSHHGRPKVFDTSDRACISPLCDYFAIADPEIHVHPPIRIIGYAPMP